MGSTFPSTLQPAAHSEPAVSTLQWRSWPLVDHRRWSWALVVGVLAIGAIIRYVSASWLLAAVGVAGVGVTLWQFFVPVWYELSPLGLRQRVFGRSRLLAWHTVRSYQLRPTGVVFHRRAQPAPIEMLRSTFMPYPLDADEAILVLRANLPHAMELPVSSGAGGWGGRGAA